MGTYHEIQKISFIITSFNIEKMELGSSLHYEIYRDGMINTYEVAYRSKKHEHIKRISISKEKVISFFEDVKILLSKAEHSVCHIDDCGRKWVIYYEGHKEIIEEDFETNDHNFFQGEFYKFLKNNGVSLGFT